MDESASPHSQTETSPLTGPSSLGSAVDPQGLTTVHEVPHYSVNYHENGSLDKRLASDIHAPTVSREASCSSVGHSYNEPHMDEPPENPPQTGPTQAARQAWQRSETPAARLENGNGYHRDIVTEDFSKPASSRKLKRGGFRNTLRRMFGRKDTRDRISVPNPTVYPRHVCPTPSFDIHTRY